jgi:D-sedoheptulose 7-phosphate isomerase
MDEAAAGRTVRAIFEAAIALHATVRDGDHSALLLAARAMRAAHAAGGRTLIFGNGGSAADAQHMAAELVNRFQRERAAIAAIALTTDASIVTSIGNDYGFEHVFARQVDALGRPGDVALGISTSGASPNVRRGLEAGRRRGLTTIALTGRDGGEIGRMADIHINVPGDVTARVQEVHATLIHAMCELVENDI